MRRSSLVFILSLTLAGAAHAQPDATKELQAAIQKVEIAGVFWGQKEDDAARELTRRGYTLDLSSKANARPFPEQIRFNLEMREKGLSVGRDGHTFRLKGTKANESVVVTLVGYPDGWRVSHVRYENTGGLTPRELGAKADKKYQAAGLTESGYNYCIRQAASCQDMPYLIVRRWGSSFDMELQPGALGEKTADAPFSEALAKAIGLGEPTF